MQQKMAFFVMPPKSNNSVHLEDTKSSWIPITKEGNLLIIPREAKNIVMVIFFCNVRSKIAFFMRAWHLVKYYPTFSLWNQN